MQRNDSHGPTVEKALYTKLSSLDGEDVSEIERFRKKLNVIEVKIDNIYNHLLASNTVDPKEALIDKLNVLAAALLTIGLALLSLGILLPEDLMVGASAGISLCGLLVIYISLYLQSSRKAKYRKKSADES